MDKRIIDAHIHLDMYHDDERKIILQEMAANNVDTLISVSNNLPSAKLNLEISKANRKVKSAFGYHPEQHLPTESEMESLIRFIHENQNDMIAVGEVGLPYYLRKENPLIPIEPYVEILEKFIRQSVVLDKPIVLHAVYEDAPIVCDLLEKYSVEKAHFHWFKGDLKTIERVIRNGYFISITPDVLYEKEIQQLVKLYPLSQIMVETDGPWPFEGNLKNKMTHPKMIHQSLIKIAEVKRMDVSKIYYQIFKNTSAYYGLRM